MINHYESETVSQIGQLFFYFGSLWIVYKIIVLILFVWIFIKIFNWFTGKTVSIFELINKFAKLKTDLKNEEIKNRDIYWENQIDERIKKLDNLKSNEIKIRSELDKINQLKDEIDKTKAKENAKQT